jgi:hypothetical protein
MNAQKDQGLFSRGMLAVIAAQFLSAMADNALLFGALAWTVCDHGLALAASRPHRISDPLAVI